MPVHRRAGAEAASTPVATAVALPQDTVLLPLRRGGLLVSAGHAVFCGLAPVEAEVARAALATGEATLGASALAGRLAAHGFGGPPRPAKPEAPSVQLQLTNRCNLECSYCCTNSGAPRAAEVSREQALAVVDDARAVLGEGTRVALLGGEPLLVPWALDVAERAVGLGLAVTLFTNGTPLVDDALAGRVAALGRRGLEVRVSLAGPTPERCDAESGAVRFERAIEGVWNVHRREGRPIVDLMLLPDDVDSVAQGFRDLRRRLPPGQRITLGVLYLSGRETGQHVFPSRARLEEALDRIAFEAGEVIAARPPSPLADRREGCTCALGHHLHVRSDGALFTCFKMEEAVGHLHDGPFAARLRARATRARPTSTMAFCAPCPLRTLCGGGCRSENLQLTGDPEQPLCGPWRVEVLAELLSEDRTSALEWQATHLAAEARSRGIAAPERFEPARPSRHLIDT